MSQDCIIHTQAFYGYVSYAGIILCRIPCPNSSRATCSVRGYSSVSTDSSRRSRVFFRVLVESDEPMTIDAVAEAVDRERSTAYRSVQRLLQTGFITKEQINYDQGGYYHVYSPTDPPERRSPTRCSACSTTGTRRWDSSFKSSKRTTGRRPSPRPCPADRTVARRSLRRFRVCGQFRVAVLRRSPGSSRQQRRRSASVA